MREKIAKLIDVKTVVTFAVVGVIVYLSAIGKIEPKDILSLGMIIITFFFTKKNEEVK